MAKMESALTFQLVVAATKQLGIGKAGKMPWKLPKDMAHFKHITSTTNDGKLQNAVIMGRKTWESIPSKFRPLPGRVNIVLSRSFQASENGGLAAQNISQGQAWAVEARKQGVLLHPSLEAAMSELATGSQRGSIESVFVIGGGQVYEEAIQSPQCSAIHFTEILGEFECDTFFPPIDRHKWRLWSASKPQKDGNSKTSFQCYVPSDQASSRYLPEAVRRQHNEYQYLDTIEDVMENGVLREDRTGTGTVSNFGCQMRFDLRHSFPLLTTKRVFWRGVAEELLWFIRGDTNAKRLKDKDIHIWDGNSSRAYLDSIGLKDREENDLGPVYGFQWRHFGAEYKDMHTDYSNQGVDQLSQVINKLKNNPTDRRIILSAWNPAALPQMALPPCHMFAQFYVANGELSCQMYQRSADLGLGVPFNIASYALLTYLLAKVCDLQVGDLVHVLGDAHVYVNHVEPLKEQLKNMPRPFPTLNVKRKRDNIEDYTMDDLELIGYNPHKKIAMQMAV